MKVISIIAFILFLCLTVYVLLTKKIPSGKFPQKLSPPSTSKVIGEKKTVDLPAYELQKQRINDEAVIKFQDSQSGEAYELREDELSDFTEALEGVKKAPNTGVQGDFIHPNTVIEQQKKKEYYEID